MNHLVTRIAVLTAAGALAAAGLAAPSASAQAATHHGTHHGAHKAGQRSLATVLAADGTRLDRNWQDFDIVEQGVIAVLGANPDSPVSALTDGSIRLTAFAPTDEAFRDLVGDLTGKRPRTEKQTLARLLEAVDLDTLEQVLLYHVVPGKTLASPAVIKAAKAGTKLKTAQGGTVKVVDRKGNITLVDKDRGLPDPQVILNGVDINKGNRQIAHAIDHVLLPVAVS
jgi:uncharacterized surface protein with fasciclin (FAS1) repeats